MIRELRACNGRFASTAGIYKLHISNASTRYELLVFDRNWRLIGPLNEWYRLRKARGSPRTRDSYLAMLCPFVGFLINNDYAWNAEPDLVREYTRQYLIASGCVVRRAWQTDGYHVALTNGTTFSPSGLNLFIAAARDFYATLIEGDWNQTRKRWLHYYSYPNPMYSELLCAGSASTCGHSLTPAHRKSPVFAGNRTRQARRSPLASSVGSATCGTRLLLATPRSPEC